MNIDIDLDTFEYNKIVWIAQFFISSNQERRNEIEEVIRDNCTNPEIDEIHLLNEEYYDLPILDHPKIRQINLGKRMSYYDAFFYSLENLELGSIKMVSNNDITFNEEDLRCLRFKSLENKVLCLLRYEFTGRDYNKNTAQYSKQQIDKRNGEAYSQDTWIYTNVEPAMDMNIHLGTWGCDNRIAKVLKDCGYQVINNCLSIRTYHHHFSNHRTYVQQRVPGDYIHLKSVVDHEIENIRKRLFVK
jgi:hypothetical protein